MLAPKTRQTPADKDQTLAALTAPLQPCLDGLTEFLAGQVDVFEDHVRELVTYCLRYQGKRLRPMLLFYSGWGSSSAQAQADLIKAAAVVELVHLATLVHDDILDDATIRHSSDTVSARWGAHTAVLLGDAIFAHSLNLAASFPTVDVCREVSRSTRLVCSGEIRQTFGRGNANLSVEEYYRVIDYKTAELFRVSCLLGARLGGYDEAFAQAAAQFGRSLGIAYQIFDDVADFLGDEDTIGKTLGTDFASGKYTLPLLLHLRELPQAEADALVTRLNSGGNDAPMLLALVAELRSRGIFERVRKHCDEELNRAEAHLAPFEALPPVAHLRHLIAYVRDQMERFYAAR